MINVCISHVIITLIRDFLIPKSRDLVSHNPGISGLKNGPGSRDPGIRDPGIAIPNYNNFYQTKITTNSSAFLLSRMLSASVQFVKLISEMINLPRGTKLFRCLLCVQCTH